ncbi:hypothetical protein [Pedobacter caeni]|uniref:Uncharacterized protein n=1 Tax=Pedobacter caeni TaxID=288992 RepID=A0A1M5GWG8_9SPHI|nr:hypothetical protein [Pedobacter caeni]SHG08096.1 hypothetical protein SAMN04488522_104400 [Pedobacter caeni]
MSNNLTISYSKANAISSILGKCTIKSLGSELLFPVIKLKARLSVAVKQFHELQEAIYTESGLTPNADGSISGARSINDVNNVNQALKKLSEDATDVTEKEAKLFTENHLQELFNENPTLTTNELEVLIGLVG